MKKIISIFKWVFVFFVFFQILSFTSYSHKNKNFRLNYIDIQSKSNYNFLKVESVKKVINENGLFKNKVTNDFKGLKEIEKILIKEPSARDVQVYANIDGLVNISCLEKTPLFRVQGNNKSFYVDEEMNKMTLSKSYTARVPIINGNTDELSIKDYFNLVSYIQSNKFLRNQIVQIYIESKSKIILIPNVGNHTITFGSINNIKEKFKKLELFYKKGIMVKGWHIYKDINLMFKNQIVCTK